MQSSLADILGYINTGGLVMIPMMLVSLVMWVLIIHRTIYLRRLYINNIPRKQAGMYVSENQYPAICYQGINAQLVRTFIAKRSGNTELDGYILDETVLSIGLSLEKHLAVIQVLSHLAPLLGLLGTVMGMMATFEIITIFGTGNTRAMAGGISEALISTQSGLLIAIPGLFMSEFLQKRAVHLKYRLSATGMYLKRFL